MLDGKFVEDISEAEVICENIEDLTEEEWLEKRRLNVGGSDEGVIHGCGFSTTLDLYLDKTGQKPAEEQTLEDTIALHVGHLLEDLVIKLFAEKNPGWEPFFDRRMLKHPLYPLAADCDGFVRHPKTGELYILEAKTCSENVLWDKWGAPDDDLVPEAYEWQVRHYMAVTGAVGAIIVCLAGNNKNGYRQRFIKRDLEKEKVLIEDALDFWKCVETKTPPDLGSEDGAKILASLTAKYGKSDHDTTVDMTEELADVVSNYNEIKEKRLALDRQSKELQKAEKSALANIVEVLEDKNGFVEIGDDTYNLTWKTSTRRSIPSAKLKVLVETLPDAEKFIEAKETTSLEVKKAKKK